jgi:hypothetical protein
MRAYLILSQEIKNELNNIERVVERTSKVWAQLQKAPAEQEVYVESAALNLQSFYTGLERIFQLIAERLDQELPSGKHWRTDLLTQAGLDLPGLRPPVISHTTQNLLDDYRSFRHRVRNIYTYHIDPQKVEALALDLPEVFAAFRTDLDKFLDFLDIASQIPVDD